MIRDPSDGSVREKPVLGIPSSKMPECLSEEFLNQMNHL